MVGGVSIFLLIIYSSTYVRSESDVCGEETKYYNSILSKYTPKELTLTKLNRCYQYPRCLLFDCCDPNLLANVHNYFRSLHCIHHSNFRCMFSDNECEYTVALNERKKSIELFKSTLTHKIIEDGLVNLPPTHPAVYERLAMRKEFKIIYLVQGDERINMNPSYSRIKQDFIFISYITQSEGDLFFPKSNFCYGRLALYLAARQLEISQGWLYNYFIFMDDDATLEGSIDGFENLLQYWQPAVAAPGFQDKHYPKFENESIAMLDFIVLGYHRESLEVLHPWVLDNDAKCIWSSQLLQSIESALVYRNHQMTFTTLTVKNLKHRPYPQDCGGDVPTQPLSPFDQTMEDNYQAAPKVLKHCAVRSLKYYQQGDASGNATRKGDLKYHLMTHLPVDQSNHHVHHHIQHYAQYDQSKVCPISDHFNGIPNTCCTLDIVSNSEKDPLLNNVSQ